MSLSSVTPQIAPPTYDPNFNVSQTPGVPNQPDTNSLPATSQQPQNTPQQQPSAPAPKPSLWQSVVKGALAGLAGSAGAKSLGGGLAQGAAGELQQKQQEQENSRANQAALDSKTQAAANVAHTQAMVANLQRQTMNLPPDHAQAVIEGRAAQTEAMRRTGAMVPVGSPDPTPDHHVALQQVTELTKQNPGHLYTAEPVEGADGKIVFQPMESTDAGLTEDIPLTDLNGKQIGVIPKGTPGKDATRLQVTALQQGVSDLGAKAKAAAMTAQAAQIKAAAAQTAANAKAAGAGASAMLVGSLPDGTQVAGSPDQLKQWGAQGVSKLPATESAKTVVARQLIAPSGLFNSVSADIAELEKTGNLGTVATRWNDFMSGKVGSGPQFAKLRTDMGLLGTALMQAHVGSRGSKDMIEHFTQLADYRIDDAPTLKAALSHEWNYVHEKAMLPPKTVGAQ